MVDVDLTKFEEVVDSDIHSHIYELAAQEHEQRRLGYVDRKHETIDITLSKTGIDLTIMQSLTGLSESTGYVCWQTALYLSDWILLDKTCPFKLSKDHNVVELGTGIGGLLVSVLGSKVSKYIATDQRQILKLLQHNYQNNRALLSENASYPKGKKRLSKVSTGEEKSAYFEEFDWEYVDDGVSAVRSIIGVEPVHYIIACDTIYNDYLIPPFIQAFKLLMTAETGVVIGLQIRDEELLENFTEQVLKHGLKLYYVTEDFLPAELANGFVVYYATLPDVSDMIEE